MGSNTWINPYSDVTMSEMASQINSLTIVYSTVYSGTDQRKHQSSTSLAFVRGIHRWPVNSPHKWPVRWKIFPSAEVIMTLSHVAMAAVKFDLNLSLIAMFMGPSWGPSGADRTQVGPMLAPWTLLSGVIYSSMDSIIWKLSWHTLLGTNM